MVIICKHHVATKFDGYDEHRQRKWKPDICPVCGEQMITWSRTRHGGDTTTCFSGTCASEMSIAIIRGDLKDFVMKDYDIPGSPNVIYTSAQKGKYSAELRDAVKKTLEGFGFAKIKFVEPTSSEKSEYDTMVTGVHVSALVNTALRETPKPQRGLVFMNKFGKLHLTYGYHESYENRQWGWDHIYHEVTTYYKKLKGGNTKYLYVEEIALPPNVTLKNEADAQILAGRKNRAISEITSALESARKHERNAKSYRAEMKRRIAQYAVDFGEPYSGEE